MERFRQSQLFVLSTSLPYAPQKKRETGKRMIRGRGRSRGRVSGNRELGAFIGRLATQFVFPM